MLPVETADGNEMLEPPKGEGAAGLPVDGSFFSAAGAAANGGAGEPPKREGFASCGAVCSFAGAGGVTEKDGSFG